MLGSCRWWWLCGLWATRQRCPSNPQPFCLLRRQRRRAACSYGRDHAPQRIDLYPAGTLHPLTTIDIHVSQRSDAAAATKLLLGLTRPSNFPVAARLPAAAASSIIPNPLRSPPPVQGRLQETAKTQSPIFEPAQRCRLCGHACRHRQTVAATRPTTRSRVGSVTTTRPAQPESAARALFRLCQCRGLG